MKITIELDDETVAELKYMIELHQRCGAASPQASIEELLARVASSIADGSRRPGSWERQVLQMMGLVADCEEHYQYRAEYGRPREAEAHA